MAVNTVTWSDGTRAKPVPFIVGIAHHFIRPCLGVRIRAGELVQRGVVVLGLGVVVDLDEAIRVFLPGQEGEEGLAFQGDRCRRSGDEDVTSRGFGGVHHVLRPLDVDVDKGGKRAGGAVSCVDVGGRVEDGER